MSSALATRFRRRPAIEAMQIEEWRWMTSVEKAALITARRAYPEILTPALE